MRFCICCGERNEENASVCKKCGYVFTDVVQTQNDEIQSEREVPQNKEVVLPEKTESRFQAEMLHKKHRLLENEKIEEIVCQNDFMYVLEKQISFLTTEYKVLNSAVNNRIVKCNKIKYNGKTALYYHTEQLKSLEAIATSVKAGVFRGILEDLLAQIIEIKKNGFLTAVGIDMRMKRIYVNSATKQAYLTYLPISERCYEDGLYWDEDLRDDLYYLMDTLPNLYDKDNVEIKELLLDKTNSLETVYSLLKRSSALSSQTVIRP